MPRILAFFLSYFPIIFKYDKIKKDNQINMKQILQEFNVFASCKKYGLGLWQCPQFLFLVMGIAIMISSLVTYALATRYIADPLIVSLVVLIITFILLIITFSITRSMEGLAEANRLKTEFISIVSHQLRSPLSNLRWANEVLTSGKINKLEEKQAEYFEIIGENTNRMSELVTHLLTASRIDQGKLALDKVEFSLEELFRGIIPRFELKAKAFNVDIKMEITNNLPKALGDPSQIKLVAENLLDNAVRYTKEKGLVEIRMEGKGKELLCEIKDDGVGIPKDDQKHIFQKFFRSRNAMRYQTEGSGLGLFICKSIVERSGGKIGFRSQENKGSTFWFTLPIVK
jgi:signal transduction histidine kinase